MSSSCCWLWSRWSQLLSRPHCFLPVKWPHNSPGRMSSSPSYRTAWPTCRGGFVSSPLLLPVRRSGCVLSKRVRMILTKKLCSLRELASVSSVETKIVVSDWPLPKVTGSASSSSTGRPAPARVLDFPSLLGKDKSLLSHRHRRRPQNGTNKTTSSFAVLFLSGSLVVRTRDTVKKHFCEDSIPWRGGSLRDKVEERQ